ncbi:MAG: carbamoyl-phosphate synthase, partial [Polyangiales bacterium]
PAPSNGIYSLSGYADRHGDIVTARAARKILQRPRTLGIGLCFEEATVTPQLLEGTQALCRRVGYQGVFEVEFLEVGPRALLIDFNPRFYGQMALDIDRGMPLPRMAYADALGDSATMMALAETADATSPEHVYCHRSLFELMLRAQRLSGKLGVADGHRWQRWWAAHRDEATDAVIDRSDPLPWGVEMIVQLAWLAKHPRSFVRSLTVP